MVLMRTDPFRDFDRPTQHLLGTSARPSLMLMDAWRDGGSELGPQFGYLAEHRFRQHMVGIYLAPSSERHRTTPLTHHDPPPVHDLRPTRTALIAEQMLVMTRGR